MAKRIAPTVTPDSEFFWEGLKKHELLIQRCAACARYRQPARPMCPNCTSLEWEAVPASGRGTVHSFVMPQYPPLPFMEYPYIVVLVDLAEGVRLVSNLRDIAPEDVRVDMPVEVFYESFNDDLVLHQFRPAG